MTIINTKKTIGFLGLGGGGQPGWSGGEIN